MGLPPSAIEPTRSATIEALFAPLAAAVYSASIDARNIATLSPPIHEATAPMAPQRRAEFATGRACARAALGALGLSGAPVEIGRGPRGEPRWPVGVTGSITHTAAAAVAVVAQRGASGTVVGLDLERIDRLRPELGRRILSRAEQSLVVELEPDEAQRTLAATFAIKEAFYKAHHQLEPRWLGFDVIDVVHDDEPKRVVANHDVDPATAEGTRVRTAEADGHIVAAVSITPPGPMAHDFATGR